MPHDQWGPAELPTPGSVQQPPTFHAPGGALYQRPLHAMAEEVSAAASFESRLAVLELSLPSTAGAIHTLSNAFSKQVQVDEGLEVHEGADAGVGGDDTLSSTTTVHQLDLNLDMSSPDYVCMGVDPVGGDGWQIWVHEDDARDFVSFKMEPETEGERPRTASGQLLALSQAALLQAGAVTRYFGHFVEHSKGVPVWYRRVAYGFHDTKVWGPPH